MEGGGGGVLAAVPWPHLLTILPSPLLSAGANPRRNLVHTRPPSTSKVGTYAAPCVSCDKHYFGKTGVSLTKHLSQHKYAVYRVHNNSALFLGCG